MHVIKYTMSILEAIYWDGEISDVELEEAATLGDLYLEVAILTELDETVLSWLSVEA